MFLIVKFSTYVGNQGNHSIIQNVPVTLDPFLGVLLDGVKPNTFLQEKLVVTDLSPRSHVTVKPHV